MQILCDVCEKLPATVMCCADEAALCPSCDEHIHAANKLASKHQRLQLTAPSPERSAACDICQEKTGYFFCLEDRAFLCRNCDFSIHSSNALTSNHRRFLVTGSRVSLHTIPSEDVQAVVETPGSKQGAGKGKCLVPMSASSRKLEKNVSRRAVTAMASSNTISKSSLGFSAPLLPESSVLPVLSGKASPKGPKATPLVMRKNTISEYLTEALEGWGTDEFLTMPDITSAYDLVEAGSSKADAPLWDLDWPGSLNLLEEQPFGDSFAEVPQVPCSPTVSGRWKIQKCPKMCDSTKSKSRQEYVAVSGFDDTSLVPDLGYHSPPRLSPCSPKRRRTLIEL